MRGELSRKNENRIAGRRYYELKYFCLQYHEWRKEYQQVLEQILKSPKTDFYTDKSGHVGDRVQDLALKRNILSTKMQVVIDALDRIEDKNIRDVIYHGVTEGHSYKWQLARYDMPCSESEYYYNYRKFFKVLDKIRD